MKRNVTKTRQKRKRASTRTASQKADAEQALAKQAHKYEEALTKGDVETLDKIWTPDYTFVNPRGELLNKAQRIANIKSGATEFETMRRHKERLLVHGDFAVEVGRIVVEGEYSGRESSGPYRYTSAWIKIKGRWQMLANQITLIATTIAQTHPTL
jgi:ketosteroid isomerase-like protein